MLIGCEVLAFIKEMSSQAGSGLGHQQMCFMEVGVTRNKWLGFMHPSSSSDVSPGPVWVNSVFRGFVYTNEKSDSSAYIQIFKNGITATEKIVDYHVDATQIVCKSNYSLPVSACDRISLYLAEDEEVLQNKAPDEPRVWLFFEKATDATFGEGQYP